jgi:V/A-type H+-transporting ATPase subunit I
LQRNVLDLLRPATMQKIAVIGLRDDRQRILSILYDLGVVQIEPLSKSALQYLQASFDNVNSREVLEELLRIRSLKTALPVRPQQDKRGFASLGELISTSKSIRIDDEVSKLVREQNRLHTRADDITDKIDLVSKISYVNEDLRIFDLESATSFFGTFSEQEYQNLTNAVKGLDKVILYTSKGSSENRNKDRTFSLIAVVPNDQLEKFGQIIQKSDLRLRRIPPLKGLPQEVLSRLTSEKQSITMELNNIQNKLMILSERYYSLISSVEEQLSIEAKKFEVTNSLGFTDNIFVLEGWIPQENRAELDRVLRSDSPYTNVMTIEAEGTPPTLLENPKKLKFFESFIRFYSMPQENELDPTLVFALTFPIFFGLMLGDVGYGLAILGVALWILNRLKNPGGKTLVPRKLRAFASNIFRPSQFQKLAMAMIPGAIIGIVFGFLFNEYFGFHLNGYLFKYLDSAAHLNLPSNGAFLDPVSTLGLKELLLIAGYIGLFEVSLGLVLGILNGYWEHQKKHAIGKLGWLLTAWGIALMGLTLLHHGNTNPSTNPLFDIYIGALIAGLGLIAFGEGTRSLIELPSIISHILSFTRLLGILLASVILADVIDRIFVGTLSGGVAIAVFGVVILVFGQLFNLILAMFEPGVQGARLIYVEFFSKFFQGSGRPFSPFRGRRTYTVSEIELMNSKINSRTSDEKVLAEPIPQEAEPLATIDS